jgi:uncharacterized protein YcaQ
MGGKYEYIDQFSARRLALAGAAGFPPPYAAGAAGAAEFLERVGYVQIDTISVVARAHEHALWTRAGAWSPAPFAALEGQAAGGEPAGAAGERRAFEYWAHAASYLPLSDYRFCLPRMERIRRDGHEWFRADPASVAEALAMARAEGPIRSSDFTDPRGGASGWWDWKPAKRALEYLFHSGQLLVATRRGFAKVFDLPERVLPAGTDLRTPTAAEAAARFLDRAADALGVFAEAEAAYNRRDLVEGLGAELAARVEDGRLLACRVEGTPGRTYYAAPGALAAAARAGADGGPDGAEPRAWVLSPFDPFVIDRARLKRLFGFDYTIECYLPAAKRKFGYFALPVVAVGGAAGAGGVVGLVDAKADRRSGRFVVRRLALAEAAGAEAWPRRGAADLAAAVGRALADYARYLGAGRIEFERLEAPTRPAGAALLRAARLD